MSRTSRTSGGTRLCRVRLATVAIVLALATGACTARDESPATTRPPASGPAESSPQPAPGGVPTVRELWSGLDKPLFVTAPPDDPRVFVVEQGGVVRVAENRDAPLADAPFLDISESITSEAEEQGLLGMAFHPSFAETGGVYLDYTNREGDTRVVEFTVDPDTGTAPATVSKERTILAIDQPFENHNAGMLAFGPDEWLYVGTGDGGSADDPDNNAQNPSSRLGKMLRLDVDDPESVETYAIGLRNPYRFSFDRETGDLWIGDVGQDAFEEVDVIRAGTPPGLNLGWRIFEGFERNRDDEIDHHEPVAVYPLEGDECSVIGGYVYRGPGLPQYQGTYFFGDYCSGLIRTLDAAQPGDPAVVNDVLDAPQAQISSFGEDAEGRLYLVDHGGSVYVLEERS